MQFKKLFYRAKCSRHCVIKINVGKTTQTKNGRISGRRGKFSVFLYIGMNQLNEETHLLGLHFFHKHNLKYKTDFDSSYTFIILEK